MRSADMNSRRACGPRSAPTSSTLTTPHDPLPLPRSPSLPPGPQTYLQPGERVMAIVVEVAPDLSRVELSTAHLEVQPGDMQNNRKSVFATADRQAAVVRRQMAEAAAAAEAEAAAAAAAEAEAAAAAAHEQAWCEQPAVPLEEAWPAC
jgi:hypothetical protein